MLEDDRFKSGSKFSPYNSKPHGNESDSKNHDSPYNQSKTDPTAYRSSRLELGFGLELGLCLGLKLELGLELGLGFVVLG
jgi:hypothetical protein